MDLMTIQYSRNCYNLESVSRDSGVTHTNTLQDVVNCTL
jgi:hypothetical protein